ncbi:Protein of unknown function [Bacillus mycoides]|nr:Protein of unknown function [Bacillus mycoides]
MFIQITINLENDNVIM